MSIHLHTSGRCRYQVGNIWNLQLPARWCRRASRNVGLATEEAETKPEFTSSNSRMIWSKATPSELTRSHRCVLKVLKGFHHVSRTLASWDTDLLDTAPWCQCRSRKLHHQLRSWQRSATQRMYSLWQSLDEARCWRKGESVRQWR